MPTYSLVYPVFRQGKSRMTEMKLPRIFPKYEKIQVCSICGGFYSYPHIRDYPKDKEMKHWEWECNECVIARMANLNKGILDMKANRNR